MSEFTADNGLTALDASDDFERPKTESDRIALEAEKRQRDERAKREAAYAEVQEQLDAPAQAQADAHGLTLTEFKMAEATGMTPSEYAQFKSCPNEREAAEIEAAEQARAEARKRAEADALVAQEAEALASGSRIA